MEFKHENLDILQEQTKLIQENSNKILEDTVSDRKMKRD